MTFQVDRLEHVLDDEELKQEVPTSRLSAVQMRCLRGRFLLMDFRQCEGLFRSDGHGQERRGLFFIERSRIGFGLFVGSVTLDVGKL